ncbi:hypothetical protein D3C75_1320170 [compost metagenome]
MPRKNGLHNTGRITRQLVIPGRGNSQKVRRAIAKARAKTLINKGSGKILIVASLKVSARYSPSSKILPWLRQAS